MNVQQPGTHAPFVPAPATPARPLHHGSECPIRAADPPCTDQSADYRPVVRLTKGRAGRITERDGRTAAPGACRVGVAGYGLGDNRAPAPIGPYLRSPEGASSKGHWHTAGESLPMCPPA